MKRNVLFAALLCCSIHSFSQWKWLNPKPTGIANTKIVFTDAAQGFLFNGHGELFKTIDGGASWQLHKNFPNTTQMELADSTGVVIAGRSIYISKDNGATWQTKPGIADGDINRVNIVSRDTIILLTNASFFVHATLLISTDRGETWEKRTASISLNGGSFEFVNSKIGFATGGERYTPNYGIFKTIDGGISWQLAYSIATTDDIITLKFYDANLGYAYRSSVGMLKTTDGGATWTSSTLIDQIFSISFLNPSTAYAVGDHGVVYKTTDAGVNWVWTSPGNRIYAHNLYSQYFFNEMTGFVTGDRGRILKTTDGGVSWQAHSPFYEDATALSFGNPSTGYVSNGVNIYKTTDAGETWSFKFSIGTTWGQIRHFNNSIFFNADTGLFTANYNAHIYKTYDGGNTWKVIYPTPSSYEYVAGMSFVNSRVGYASFRTSSAWGLYKTTDAAETWNEMGSYQDFTKLHFLNEQTGYGIQYRKLFRTTDSANTWTEVLNAGEDLNALYFFDAAKGFVAGNEGYLASTIDSGHTWRQIRIANFYGDFRSVKFADPMIGFLATDGGMIYKTIDGGLSWQAEGPNSYYKYEAIALSKDSSVYIGGVFGSLLKNSLPAYGIDSLAISNVTSCGANFAARVIAAMSAVDSVWIQYGINDFDSTITPAAHAITDGIIHPGVALTNLIPGAPYKIRVKIYYKGSYYYSSTFFFSPNSQPVPVILANGNVLSTFAAANSYQWYLDGVIIPGAVNRELTATVSDVYTVKVPDPGCADVLSAGYNFTVTSTVDPVLDKELRIYPNPVTDELFFENDKLRHLSLRLSDINGRVLLVTEIRQRRESISIKQLAAGFYFIRLTDVKTKKMVSRKILKM